MYSKESSRKYYQKHKAERNAYARAYIKAHPYSYEQTRMYSKRYYQRHREMVKAKSLAYYYKRKAEQI